MALTRDLKATVQARVQADPAFREALLREGIETLLSGDVDTGKAILRDYIKATVGFEKHRADIGPSGKILMRMFGPTGNRQARNLFVVREQLQSRRVAAACNGASASTISESGPQIVAPCDLSGLTSFDEFASRQCPALLKYGKIPYQ